MSKSNKYGYVGVDIPSQNFGSNKGVFDPAEINELVADNKWTQYGQLELIETQTLTTDTASVIFDEIQQDVYNVHFITYNNAPCDSSGNRLKLRFFENGVEESGSVYQYALQLSSGNGTFSEAKSTGQDNIHLGTNTETTDNGADNGYIYIYNAGDSTKYTFTTQHTTGLYFSGEHLRAYFGSGVLPQTSTVDQFKIYASNGNIETGASFSLYGIRYS